MSELASIDVSQAMMDVATLPPPGVEPGAKVLTTKVILDGAWFPDDIDSLVRGIADQNNLEGSIGGRVPNGLLLQFNATPSIGQQTERFDAAVRTAVDELKRFVQERQAKPANPVSSNHRGGPKAKNSRVKIGQKLGRWTIDGEPFTGGNAKVYPVSSGSELGALKLLHRKTEEAIARFQREIEALRKVPADPNVVRLVDVYLHPSDDASSWYVMEFITGGNLRESREKFKGQLLPSIRLVRQAASGVNVIHKAGVLHRDLKPDNILMREDGTPVVSDLGLAWLRDFPSEKLSPDGRAIGAWGFRAPEHEHTPADEMEESSDVFSLAKILWWLIDGGYPFASAHFQLPEFDLARKYGDVRMHAITTLLSKTVTASPKERVVKTVAAVLDELAAILKQLERPAGSKIAIMVATHLEQQRKNERAIEDFQQREARLQEALPKMFDGWKEPLRERVAAANDMAHDNLFAVIDSPPGSGKLTAQIGFRFQGREYCLRYDVSTSFHTGMPHFSHFVFGVIINDIDRSAQLGLNREFRPILVGEQACLVDTSDNSEVPVDPGAFWDEMMGKAMGFGT